jgi:hypothetical protein
MRFIPTLRTTIKTPLLIDEFFEINKPHFCSFDLTKTPSVYLEIEPLPHSSSHILRGLPMKLLTAIPIPTILAALFLAAPALAAEAPAEMVTIPRDVAEAAAAQIRHPNPINNIDTLVLLQACMADNPQGGRLVRQGADQCPSVTDVLAAHDKVLADAQATIAARDKTIADLKAEAPKEPVKASDAPTVAK